MSILNILDKLKENPSKLKKLAILNENVENEVLRQVFLAAYDPLTSYYMIKLPEYTKTFATGGWEDVFGVLNKLSSREVTGHAAKRALADVLATVDNDTVEVVERILQHDLRAGCSSNTANKIWKNLIQKYPCMLCESFSDKNLARVQFPAIVQEKCDGMRVNFVVNGDEIKIFSRSGKEINILGILDESILQVLDLMNENSGVIDGELLVVDDSGELLPRAEGNGILNKAIKGTISEEEASKVVTKVWDFIPTDEFSGVKNAKGTTPLHTRWDKILVAVAESGVTNIFTPETLRVNALETATSFYQTQLSKGREGAVLKSLAGVWENRRSRTQVKLKVENEVELRVIGKNEGKGEFVGTLGSLRCISEDSTLEVNVSGMSKEQRDYFWMSQDIIGSIITVKSNDYQKSESKDTLSLFLPVFIEERLDKCVANTTEEIKQSFDKIYGRAT